MEGNFNRAQPDSKPAVKIVQIGDSEVGKTSLLLQYTEGKYRPSFVSTIGVDYKKKTVKVGDGDSVRVQIWDTAGQARMRNIVPTYMQGSQGLMIVYDVTNLATFESVKFWMGEIKKTIKRDNVPKILVGNKVDGAAGSRQVSFEQGLAASKEHNCVAYIETSAKTNTNVSQAFTQLVEATVKMMAQQDAEAEAEPAAEAQAPAAPAAAQTAKSPSPKKKGGGIFACCGSKS